MSRRSDFYFEDVLQDKEVEEDFVRLPLAPRVFRVSRFFFFFLVFIVGVQLFRIGIFQHDDLGSRASANIHNFRLLPAPRGEIVDRYGNVLAKTESLYEAYLLPRELPENDVEREDALIYVSSFFDLEMNFLLKEFL